jgi:hypothetical protein
MIQVLVSAVTVAILAISPLIAAAQSPGGEDAAIKNVLETMVRAVNKDQLTTMLDQFSDDAKIDSRAAGGLVSKEKYKEVMVDVFKKGDLISADIRDISITMTDPSKATALGTVYLQTKASRLSGRAEYKLEKRDGRWLIVETMRK